MVAVPILALAVAVLLELRSSEGLAVRYAVLDRSGWLGDAIRRRMVADDVAAFLDALARAPRDDPLLAGAVAARASVETPVVELIHTLVVESGRIRSPADLRERFADWWIENAHAVVVAAPGVSFATYVEVQPVRPLDHLEYMLDEGLLDGYFVIPDDSVGTGAMPRYVTRRRDDRGLAAWYQDIAGELVERQRLLEENAAQ